MESTDPPVNLTRSRERVGPGGDPMVPPPEPGEASGPGDPPGPGEPTGAADPGAATGPQAAGPAGVAASARVGRPTVTDVVVDCGWGRLVFGQTFTNPSRVADVLRSEAAGARDICMYLPDPHVLVSRLPDELFIDPSLTYRLDLRGGIPAAGGRPPGVKIRPLVDRRDARAVNVIYARNGMITAPVDVLVDNAASDRFIYLVAESPTGEIVGTVTGVDHVAAFGDPERGSSLWCLTVDPNFAPPGTGKALLRALATRLVERGRAYVDLSVLAENEGAIRLYERLGFHRIPTLCVKRKNPINERLFLASLPEGYDALNPYAKIIADEAMRRGIRVEVTDPGWGELRLTNGARTVVTRESLSELTSAVAMSRCDDKRVTRRVLTAAGLRMPRGRTAAGPERDLAFLREITEAVVKPARGEQGAGITVGVRTPEALREAVALARRHCPDVLIEERCQGEDLRVVVINYEVVAAAVRRPASVLGDGVHTIAQLIDRQSRRRAAATGGESRIPVDEVTRSVVHDSGHTMDEVLPEGQLLAVRHTANLHTGGTIHDVTARLHPALAAACVAASQALDIPVTGLDLLVRSPDQPEYVFIEANERPGLANHEPQPTTERFIDLLFPGTSAPPRPWTPTGAAA